MNFINWIIDSLASSDVIDAYFIQSDLVDINLTEAELCEIACFDALATDIVNKKCKKDKRPMGKRVY